MLTDIEVKKAKAQHKPYKLSDSGNMYLWVTPSGGKIWRWAYRWEGKEKLMVLGKYPAVSLVLARGRRDEAKKLLATGTNPMAVRKIEKSAEQVANENSFASIAGEWLEHWQDGKSPRHVDSTRRRLNSNILPSLGALQITAIDAPDIVAMVRTIEAGGARDIAKRAMETTGQIFRYAIAKGKARRNPNYARIDEKELPHLLKEIELYRGTPLTRLALKLMALTFVRTSELIGARWSEFDFEAARWNIPAERMK